MKGKKNSVVDALSKTPTFHAILVITTYWKVEIMVEYAKNVFISNLRYGNINYDMYNIKEVFFLQNKDIQSAKIQAKR